MQSVNHMPPLARTRSFVLVGGAGTLGSLLARELLAMNFGVSIVDSHPPLSDLQTRGVTWLAADLLTEEVILPPGDVVILLGSEKPHPRWLWTLALDGAVATARLLPGLAARKVILVSPLECDA